MNVELLRQVREQILAEPTRFGMKSWVDETDDFHRKPECGTACCIGGWAGMLTGLVRKRNSELLRFPADLTVKGQKLVNRIGAVDKYGLLIPSSLFATALDISGLEATRLFYVDHWPESFRMPFYNEKDAKKRARIAAKRINRFIKTKGAE